MLVPAIVKVRERERARERESAREDEREVFERKRERESESRDRDESRLLRFGSRRKTRKLSSSWMTVGAVVVGFPQG